MAAHWVEEELKETVARLLLYTVDVLRAGGIDPSERIALHYVAEAIVNAREEGLPPFRQLARAILDAVTEDRRIWDQLPRRLLLFAAIELGKNNIYRGKKNELAHKYVLDAMETYLSTGDALTDSSFREIAKMIRTAIQRDFGHRR